MPYVKQPIRIITHGTGGYARGCRCDVCQQAYRDYHNAYRKRPDQKNRRRDEGLKTRYGITRDDLNAMITEQGGCCAICRELLAEHKHKSSRTHVDHDPRTGKRPVAGKARVRGVLCNLCNQGLGKFRDDPDRLERAAAYVRQGGW